MNKVLTKGAVLVVFFKKVSKRLSWKGSNNAFDRNSVKFSVVRDKLRIEHTALMFDFFDKVTTVFARNVLCFDRQTNDW